jgi:ketosteroid isomerase-like protein
MTGLPIACLAVLLAADAAPPATAAAAPLRAADVALDRAVAERDRAAFAALLTPDTYWSSGGSPIIGPEAVLRDWDDFFQPGGPTLRWAPDRAEVAASGDLGFTVGTWTLTARAPDGTPLRRTGQYVTVWGRAGGAYRVLVDSSLQPPAGPTGEGVRTPERRATAASGELRMEAGRYALSQGGETGTYLVVIRAAGGHDQVLVETLVPAPRAK